LSAIGGHILKIGELVATEYDGAVTDPDAQARALAAESLAVNDPTGWFERLYVAAGAGTAEVPWDRGAANPVLTQWAQQQNVHGDGRRAVVVGCGLGMDAEFVAAAGFATTAFDVSETGVRTARERFPDSAVDYRTANLLDPPAEWRHGFDFVLESLTVQSLPPDYQRTATHHVADLVAAGGTLLVIAMVPSPADDGTGPPWLLSRADIEAFAYGGLESVLVEEIREDTSAWGRWRAEFRRPAGDPT